MCKIMMHQESVCDHVLAQKAEVEEACGVQAVLNTLGCSFIYKKMDS